MAHAEAGREELAQQPPAAASAPAAATQREPGAAAGGGTDETKDEERWLPAQGERVDALDLSGKWQEAEVIHLSEDGSMVRVHYIGWQSHWDETITFASGRVRPAFTTLKPWREGVRVGDSVEVRNPHNRLQWVWARVSAVDETARRVQCGDRREWVDLDGEDITPTNTHFAESFGREAVKLRSLLGRQ